MGVRSSNVLLDRDYAAFYFLYFPGFKIVLVNFLNFVVQSLHVCRSYVVEEPIKNATESDDRG